LTIGGKLKKKLKSYLIIIGIIALFVSAIIPIELVPSFLIGRWGWSKLMAFISTVSFEMIYIYVNYYAGLWLLKQITKGTAYQKAIHGRFIQWILRITGSLSTTAKKDNWLIKAVKFVAGGSYVFFLSLSGFVPQAMKPGIIACVIRRQVTDCKFIVLGTVFKLILCTWMGEAIYRGIFGFSSFLF